MVKRGAKSDYKRLLALWRENPQKPLAFNQILNEAKNWGYTKRTVINYVNQLVREKFLEKTVDINRNTFYKPTNPFEVKKEGLKEFVSSLNDETFLKELEEYASLEPYFKIFEKLAFQRGASTQQLTQQLNIPQTQISEYLTTLEKVGFIQKIGEGWQLNFETVLGVCHFYAFANNVEKVSEIAKAYRDFWIVFQEWEKLTSDKETARLVLNGLYEASNSVSSFSSFHYKLLAERIKNPLLGEMIKEIRETPGMMQYLKAEAALHVFYLKIIFEAGFPQELTRKKNLVKLWSICAKTPTLKTFILEQLEAQKQKAQTIEKFAEFFQQLAEKESG